ncbi:MAG: cobalamin biosynthesis protein CobD [Rhodospirillales bacterium]|nr:cobalamin biosynthesis protein CobD [Rhodospirillales bacterium]
MLLPPFFDAAAPSIALILLAALAIDAVLGEFDPVFRRLPHPAVLMGRAVAAFERMLNGGGGHSAATLRWRGALAVVVLVALAAAIGLAIACLARAVSWLWPVEALVVAILLAQRSLYDHVRAVADGLDRGGLGGGRDAVSHIVGRDPMSLDEHGVSRAAIESLAENFSDAVVAPTFWYLVLGLPGILAYKTINTLDSMIGHKTARYLHFGMVAARLDDLVNLLPARLSGLWIAFAALPRGRFAAAVRSMLRDASTHRSPNAGWPEAAMAGALDIKLAGPRKYPGEVVDAPFIGPGTPDVTAADIRQALRLFVGACVVNAAAVALLILA